MKKSRTFIAVLLLVTATLVYGFDVAVGKTAAQQTGARQESISDGLTTSFENVSSGEFSSLDTETGTWKNVVGKVLVDSKHAKSGKQCLQIAGGKESSVELHLPSPR